VGELWVVDKGLKPGEQVIVAGLQYVRAGMAVQAKADPSTPTGSPAGR
jgi:membrane fusion protein (multidrug efflux system)